jgi:hypothetical protein
MVFFISSAVFVLGSIVYFILGSGVTQEWAIKQSNYDEINVDKKNYADEKIY